MAIKTVPQSEHELYSPDLLLVVLGCFTIHVFEISKPHATGLSLRAVPEGPPTWFEHSSALGRTWLHSAHESALAVWAACATHGAGSQGSPWPGPVFLMPCGSFQRAHQLPGHLTQEHDAVIDHFSFQESIKPSLSYSTPNTNPSKPFQK